MPILLNINKRASHASLTVKVFNGNASTQRDAESVRHIIYLWPLEDFGFSGPIKSIETCSKGVLLCWTCLIGTRSNFVTRALFWHFSQLDTKFRTSCTIEGQ